ncbi:MAG: rRNA maturation RNase YbeY [Alphaproteobacteria bacterium]
MTASLTVDVTVSAGAWQRLLPDAGAVARTAAEAAWRSLGATGAGGAAEVSILLADDETVQALNRRHRDVDRPTNVLSFAIGAAPGGPLPRMLGDVVLADGVVVREAVAQGKSVSAHLSHLVVHGVLHLLGYDHEADPEAETMEALEVRTLAGLGIADPYRCREAAE